MAFKNSIFSIGAFLAAIAWTFYSSGSRKKSWLVKFDSTKSKWRLIKTLNIYGLSLVCSIGDRCIRVSGSERNLNQFKLANSSVIEATLS
jgi:hypothetical protein